MHFPEVKATNLFKINIMNNITGTSSFLAIFSFKYTCNIQKHFYYKVNIIVYHYSNK